MRDLEFLPAWYPQLRRRKRLMLLHAYMTLVIAGGLGLWMFLAHRNVRSAEAAVTQLEGSLTQTQGELQKLAEKTALQNQLLQQKQIEDKLGLHVESTRMLTSLEAIMPRSMSVLELSLETQEQLAGGGGLAGAVAREEHKEQAVDRRLRVRLVGVSPSGEDVANFLAQLSNVPFFDQVAMTYARDRIEAGHMMREFEVTFSLSLNSGGN